MAFRSGLLLEVLRMAVDTLRGNKMRSALTITGVVIGVSSIVGMTALIRGFGDQMESLIRQLGSDTVYVSKLSIASFASGKKFLDLIKRPNLSEEDARAIKTGAPSVNIVGMQLGYGPFARQERFSYRDQTTVTMVLTGVTANFPETNYLTLKAGRFFTDYEVQHRRNVIVLGWSPADVLYRNVDPIGKQVRFGKDEYTVIGVLDKRPSPLGGNPDAFGVIPHTTYEKKYEMPRIRGLLMRPLMIAVLPYPGTSRDQVQKEVEEVMRSRHHLKLDQENDFDIVTSDLVMKIFDQLTQAIVLALVVISSIALLVGGIGVMAIMTISVTERTREIGVRKALGARRREILWQFLIEAVFLTSLGGILGILIGSGIGLVVNFFAGFPVSLPWWSFALGLSFSGTIGIFFGIVPAMKAARLDPIEALRYE
jgi:putative ABC transport system permease protein